MSEARDGNRTNKPGRPRRGDKKRHLLDVACQLFAQFGYASVGFEQIAESAGVTRAALARSFPDKPALLRAIGAEWLAPLFPVESAPEDSPIVAVNRLLDFSKRFVASLRANQPTARVILTGLTEPAEEEETAIVRGVLLAAVERLAPIIQEGQQSGVVRRGLGPAQAAGDWVRLLLGAVLLPGPEPTEGDLPTQLIETLLHGVLKTDV
jgi:AcrR family transcriptional regulator